jgi:predicted Zn-dependent protease
MNAGDAAIERNDSEAALREYGAAEAMFPGNAEMAFWHAVALVNMGKLEESLPLFRRVFAMEPSWADLVPRLPRSGILPEDPEILDRIRAQSR